MRILLYLILIPTLIASQMVNDPSTLRFRADPDHDSLTRYESRTRRVSDNVVLETNNLGLPTPVSGIIESTLSLGSWVQNVEYAVDVRSVRLPYTSRWFTSGNTARRTTASEPPSPPPAGTVAFPGAQGYGSRTRHAYASTVNPVILRVTNLNNSGSGSLRAALTDSRPRVVIVEVSGTISLSTRIIITTPYLFFAGATAPSPGLSFRNHGISVRTHNVVIQHLRSRVGTSGGDNNAGGFNANSSARNVVFDHLSVAWAIDHSIDVVGGDDITVSNCLVAEHLTRLGADHSRPFLVYDHSLRVSHLRNIAAHVGQRLPSFKTGSRALFANNLIYDQFQPSGTAMIAPLDGPAPRGVPIYTSIVGNKWLQGPSANLLGVNTLYGIRVRSDVPQGSKLYKSDNTFSGAKYVAYRNEVSWGDPSSGISGPLSEVPQTGITILAAADVQSHVTANAGARPLDRDAIDSRIITEIGAGTGQYKSSPGTFPSLTMNIRPLTPPGDPHGDSDGDGYTNLEEWLHTYADDLEP